MSEQAPTFATPAVVTNEKASVEAIQRTVDMDQFAFTKTSSNARAGIERFASGTLVEQNRVIFAKSRELTNVVTTTKECHR